MSTSDQIDKRINFEKVIQNYENSLRGIIVEKQDGKSTKKKAFPHSAGSGFISRWVSHLRTILIGTNTLSKLSSKQCRMRVKNNSHAFILGMILDETVPESNMTQLAEGFNNIMVDSYLGLRNEGHMSNVMRDFKNEFDNEEEVTNDTMA